MRSWNFYSSSLVLMAACLAASAATAAGGTVGGRGPRVQVPNRPPVVDGAQPGYLVVDRLAAFCDLDVADAPPLSLRIEGVAALTVLPDVSVLISFSDDDE
jgi:hypothetical protein